jgi:FkbM family methyltransferase
MNNESKRTIFKWLPQLLKDLLINRWPSFTFLTTNTEHLVRLNDRIYGDVVLSLNPVYAIDRTLMYSGQYDIKAASQYQRLIKQGDICFDIGANMGSMTIPMAQSLKGTGRIFAFEPGPVLAERLRRNLELNPKLGTLVEVVELGLSNESGMLDWTLDTDNYGNAYVVEKGQGDLGIQVATLDEQADVLDGGLTKIDFIKIDVEGMELSVLQGATAALEKWRPTILFETWMANDPDCKIPKILSLLESFGYSFYEPDVPMAKLSKLDYRFGFMPSSYPRLSSNTLAVHPDRNFLFDSID